jgi:acyl-CoA thioesterase
MTEADASEAAADALALRVATAMLARDRASRALGIELLAVRLGYARVALVVREDMLSGHDLCHGGVIFTLADTAFAFACNGRNRRTLALQCSITFAAPARLGDRLEATAVERSAGGRTGTYDVEIAARGAIVAYFRGTSYATSAAVLDGVEGS